MLASSKRKMLGTGPLDALLKIWPFNNLANYMLKFAHFQYVVFDYATPKIPDT